MDTIEILVSRVEGLAARVERLADADRAHEGELREIGDELRRVSGNLSERLKPLEDSHKTYLAWRTVGGYLLKLLLTTGAMATALKLLYPYLPEWLK